MIYVVCKNVIFGVLIPVQLTKDGALTLLTATTCCKCSQTEVTFHNMGHGFTAEITTEGCSFKFMDFSGTSDNQKKSS